MKHALELSVPETQLMARCDRCGREVPVALGSIPDELICSPCRNAEGGAFVGALIGTALTMLIQADRLPRLADERFFERPYRVSSSKPKPKKRKKRSPNRNRNRRRRQSQKVKGKR